MSDIEATGDFHPYPYKESNDSPHWPEVIEQDGLFTLICSDLDCDFEATSIKKEWAEGIGYRHAMITNTTKETS